MAGEIPGCRAAKGVRKQGSGSGGGRVTKGRNKNETRARSHIDPDWVEKDGKRKRE